MQEIDVFENNNYIVHVGEIDLEMLSELRLKHPGVTVDNEVVEPSSTQLHKYRGKTRVSYISRMHTVSIFTCLQNMFKFLI